MKNWQNHILRASLAALFLSLPGLLCAQENPADLGESTSLLLAILKVASSLAVVIALMMAFVYLVKKTGINKGLKDNSLIRVLDNKMVAPKKYIAIVEIAGKTLALGVTDHNINLLSELEPAAISSLHTATRVSSSASFPQQFAGFLAKATRQKAGRGEKNGK